MSFIIDSESEFAMDLFLLDGAAVKQVLSGGGARRQT